MFFPELITSIRAGDKVLEIGPGATPHVRSNAFLELQFDSDQLKIAQRGGGLKDANFSGRPIHHYSGGKFPFKDNQFDYVICSHVIEHVVDPAAFMNEIFRVGGGSGYLEYPLITYEYLYDFDVHLHFLKFDPLTRVLSYLPKKDTAFTQFSEVSSFFYRMLEFGWDDLCAANKKLFFEGIEFDRPFVTEKTNELCKLVPSKALISRKKRARRLVDRIENKLGL